MYIEIAHDCCIYVTQIFIYVTRDEVDIKVKGVNIKNGIKRINIFTHPSCFLFYDQRAEIGSGIILHIMQF